MQPISFTNGSRIFTPSAQSQQIELTDLNGDGEIDILDVAMLTSDPGGIINVPPPVISPPTIPADFEVPYVFNEPQYCVEQPGIITTGCNSIYGVDGVVDLPDGPIPSLFCEGNKVRGFAYVPEVNGFRWIDECSCPEEKSNVNATDIAAIFIGGTTKNAAKQGAKEGLIRTIATAEDNLQNAVKYRKFLDNTLEATLKGAKEFEKAQSETIKRIAAMREAIVTGINPINGRKCSDDILKRLPAAIAREEKELNKIQNYLSRDTTTLVRIKDEMARFDSLIASFQGAKDQAKKLLNDLDHFDPARWVSALIPLTQFFVPKFCGGGAELNDECNCVPTSSGSYSTSYTNKIVIPPGYSIIESL